MKYAVICLLVCCYALPAHAQTGRWLTQSGNLEIEIAACGPALCGTAVRVRANHSMSNPAVSIGDRPALGLKILQDFTTSGDGSWNGHIYDRENGKIYRCQMRQLSVDELEIRPYIWIPLFGQTQIWRRVPETSSLR
jgi:uncharacterized protein (DUF2147 family)